jgi:DNA-binding LacI/PurR family transcriptional regulator
LYKAASGFDMIPGREIGVVGLYNTNWTDILTPKLSSISIKENEIAEITCDLIFKGANDEKVIIQPEFIDKGSC